LTTGTIIHIVNGGRRKYFLQEYTMPLNIKNETAHEYARELSRISGVSITEAVTRALKEALERSKAGETERTSRVTQELDDIALHCAALPILDDRSPDEILGYNDIGVPE
jgi:antitoxin VapB